MTDERFVAIDEIEAAREIIAGSVRETPVDPSETLSERFGYPVMLKLEHLQHTGSFKLRGATHALKRLSEAERARGVTAASTGNHGRGLAFAARRMGVRCVICMGALVPQNKIDGIRAQGAEVRIIGRSQDDAQNEVDRLVAEEGMVMIPPFDHRDIIAGQGTLGLEMIEAMPEMDTALVQLSGGGLIAGIAAALKARRPSVRVVGVSMERGAAMEASLSAGHPVQVEELPTLADSLGGGIGLENRHTFAMVRELVDEVVLLSEPEIAAGLRHAYWEERHVVEGSGAVGIATILAEKIRLRGPTMALLSGRNIDMRLHHRVISGEDVDLMGEEA